MKLVFSRFTSLGLAALALIVMVGSTVTFGQQAPAATAGPQVTFTKDVAPILYKNCVRCHRPGEIAPMALYTFEDARPWAASIKARVSKREMPPWFLDTTIGIQKYKNNPSLTDAEIATIVKWVDTGSVKGNMADMPKMPDETDANLNVWKIGTPDVIVKYPTYVVAANGPDVYGTLTAAVGTTEDRYIKAIQTRVPDIASRKVVHHALSFALPPGQGGDMGGDDDGGGQFLIEYASGKNATFYEEGTGQMLAAGQNARVSYHLHSIGEQVDAKIELGIVFWPKGYEPKHRTWSKQLGQEAAVDLDIPANGIQRRDGYTLLNSAAVLTAWQPHTHIRGKYQCLELIYPGQPVKTETVTCARWNYNWHTIYNYQDEVSPIVPAGTLLHVITWFDNTSANKNNPDPKNWVGAGTGRTIDEMGFSWIGWYDITDQEYKDMLAERKAMQQRNSNN
ncbi:MAG: hypothetical protein EXQ55_06100 [Acidobacteria bacterium]|nr:hypothetical protein [Acidobacteriota bacterium]